MLVLAALLSGPVAIAGATAEPIVPPCAARQLEISVNGKDGAFNGMQKAGVELLVVNRGPACLLPALPRVEFLDGRGRALPAARAAPAWMHPGPVMIPVRLATGGHAVTDLTWIEGPVYARNRPLRARSLRVTFDRGDRRTRLVATIDAEPGKPGTFNQPPLQAVGGEE